MCKCRHQRKTAQKQDIPSPEYSEIDVKPKKKPRTKILKDGEDVKNEEETQAKKDDVEIELLSLKKLTKR